MHHNEKIWADFQPTLIDKTMDINRHFSYWYENIYEPIKHEGEPEEYSPQEMIEFAQYYHKEQSKAENLPISDVVGQSEQLKAFGKSLQYKGVRILTDEGVEQAVKDFESL